MPSFVTEDIRATTVDYLKHVCEMAQTFTRAIRKEPRSQEVLSSPTEDAAELSALCIMHGVNVVTAHCHFPSLHNVLKTIIFKGGRTGAGEVAQCVL